MSEERCKHEMLPGQCADCRGLTEENPFEGLLIDRFYRAAQHKQACQLSFNGLEKHDIEVGEPFALAVHDHAGGRAQFKKFGYVCADCTNKIANGRGE